MRGGLEVWIKNFLPSRRWDACCGLSSTDSPQSRLRRTVASYNTSKVRPHLSLIFGWNCPFELEGVETDILHLLTEAEALEETNGLCRSRVRYATIGDLLFVHSAFPTTEHDSVFFGPDTYRFARLLGTSLAEMPDESPLRLIDVCSGSGAGGIYAARLLASPVELVLADINPKALAFSAVNAALNDLPCTQTAFSDVLDGIEGEIRSNYRQSPLSRG